MIWTQLRQLNERIRTQLPRKVRAKVAVTDRQYAGLEIDLVQHLANIIEVLLDTIEETREEKTR